MEIRLVLKHYCIQTGAKREYGKLISQYFSTILTDQEKMMLESRIEALTFFLENADFGRLRGVYPELSGADEVSVTLMVPEKMHNITIAYNDKIIPPEWKEKET